jgi:hypothetical protein
LHRWRRSHQFTEYYADGYLTMKAARLLENSLSSDSVVPKHFGHMRLSRSFQKRECFVNGEKRFGLPVRDHGLRLSHGQLARMKVFF